MKIKILDLIDFEKVNTLLEGFNKSTGFVTAILDLDGNVLSKSGWRQICTEFHRVNPETSKKCTISDTELAGKLAKGEKYHFYKCLNGLVDVAVPIIVKGEHIANLFSGQFFFEEPETSFFINQARKYGFDESIYLKALREVPVISPEKVKSTMDFLLNMTQLISELTLQKLEQAELNAALAKSEEQHLSIIRTAMDGFWLTDIQGNLLEVNETYCQMSGYNKKELVGMHISQLEVKETIKDIAAHLLKVRELGADRFESQHRRKDGSVFDLEISVQYRPMDEGQYVVFLKNITEQKQAEDALILSEMKFRKAFKTSPDAININRLSDGMYVEVSEGFTALLGYTSGESIGKTSLEMNIWANPEDRKKLTSGLIKHKNVKNLEADFRRKDGTTLSGLMSASIITLNNEPHLISITRDISEMKAAQSELQKSESRFRTAFENSASGMCLISTQGQFLQVNTKLCEILGYSDSELLNLTFLQITYPEDLSISNNFVTKSIEKQADQVHFEKRYIRKQGELIWAEVSSSLLRDEKDQPLYFITQIIDISERKKAEEALRESEERYRRLLVNLDAGVVVHAPDTSIVMNNHKASELLGLSDDQMSGKLAIDPQWKFIHEDLTPFRLDEYPVSQIIATKKPIKNLVAGVVRPEMNDIAWLTVNGFPVLDINNEIVEVVISFIEITEQILANEKIRKLNEKLEERVVERTAQLEAANKELETFTYSVSHDLKAPLRGIDGYSKLLLDIYGKNLDEEAKTFVLTIRNSTRQMNVLIEDLLEYSRLERSQKRNEPIKINDLIKSISSLYTNELVSGNYSLKTDIPDIELTADEKGLTIALRNLLENAIKFTKGKDYPVIEVGLKENALSWIIHIKDNGIGFDMKYHQRIFEIFQRLHRAEDFAGTGIGLAMVSKAMQRMNGRAWAESSLGIGSTFYLEIPKLK